MFDISSPVKASTDSPSARLDRSILTAAKGGGIVFAGTLFQSGSRVVIAFLMARLLGAEQLGLCNLALSAAFIASGLASLGLPSAVVRYVSLFASRRDMDGLWGTLQIGLGLAAVVSLLTGISLFVLAGPIAEQLFHESKLAPLLRVTSLVIPFLTLNNIVAAATRGFKKMEYGVIGQNISQPIVRLILVVALTIIIGLNATRALTAFSVAEMIAFVMLLYFLNNLFSLNRPLKTARRDTREILLFSLPVYLSRLIKTFGNNIQTMLLGALNTATSVGIFAVASQINTIGQIFYGSISVASLPIVSELYDRREWKQMERFYQTVSMWTFTLNLPLFLIVLLFPVPILSIFGRSFVGGTSALTILAWANLVNTGTGICGEVLDMTGNTSLKLVNSILVFALTLGLNLLLIPRWGVVGAAIAALAATATVNLLRLLEVLILFRLLPYNPSFLKPVAAGLVTLAVAWGVRSLSPHEANLIYTAVSVVVLLVVYTGTILSLGLSQEDRMVLSHIVQRMSAMLPR